MKIVLVMAIASPWSREVATGLHALGHDVHVVDFAGEATAAAYLRAGDAILEEEIRGLEFAGVTIHKIHTRFQSTLRYAAGARALRRVVHSLRPDITLALYGGGQALMLWLSGVRPYAVYVVGSDVLMSRGLARWLSARALGASAGVFANGVYLADATRRLAPRALVEPLCLGVRTAEFSAARQAVDTPAMICTRGFLPVYNNEYVLQGLAALDGPAPLPTTFVSKGPGLEQAKVTADRLLSREQREVVAFLGGVTTPALRRALASSQVYVSVSRSDGTSVSLLEALATGLLPILSDIPQNREWVSEEKDNGILVPLDQPHQLAKAFHRAMTDRTFRERACEVNRQLASERADSGRNLDRLASMLHSMVISHSTPRHS